jgi:quercetin dioxygenase-like cupin family protein
MALSYPVRFVLISHEASASDPKLAVAGNNGRKVCAAEVIEAFGEHAILEPAWRPAAVLPTGTGGFEIATFSEHSAQDRHKHLMGAEIYSVIRGELAIYIDDEGPYVLRAGDEVVILPGTVHEAAPRSSRLLVRVHSLNCSGAEDKYVQMSPGGAWRPWSELTPDEKQRAYRKCSPVSRSERRRPFP